MQEWIWRSLRCPSVIIHCLCGIVLHAKMCKKHSDDTLDGLSHLYDGLWVSNKIQVDILSRASLLITSYILARFSISCLVVEPSGAIACLFISSFLLLILACFAGKDIVVSMVKLFAHRTLAFLCSCPAWFQQLSN